MILNFFQAEIFLCLVILFKLLYNTRLIRHFSHNFPILYKETTIQNFVALICTLLLILNSDLNGTTCNNLFYCDQNTQLLKTFTIIISVILLPFLKNSLTLQKLNFIEFDIILLLSVLSGLLLISASDFLIVYILIEMQSLCFYILASFKRNSAFSTEAGVKYFIFGSLISCFFLLGLGILYGITGTLNFHDLSLLSLFDYPEELNFMLISSVYLITVLFLFKLAAVPFHFWAPDVYEGAPLASTIIFSILTKPILINLLMKWVFVLGSLFFYIQNTLILIGLASIIAGTFLAIKQKRFKKLIIYSSIAQVGFLILSLGLNTYDGMVYAYFFLIVYVITAILIWGNISILYSFNNKSNQFFGNPNGSLFVPDLINLFKYNSIWAFTFITIFFSVAGIPPLIGFLSKIFVILELIYFNLNFISIIVIAISSISIFYYIRIIKIIFFESVLDKYINIKKLQAVYDINNLSSSFLISTICETLLFLLFFYSEILVQICQYLVLNSSFY